MLFYANEDEDPVLRDLTQEEYKSALKIFEERIQPQDRRLMCSIYDVFAGPEGRNHNCLGCNFDEMADQVLKFLFICASDDRRLFSTQQSFSIYVLLLNSIWERIGDVFDIISVPKDYRVRYFRGFIKARRWANFFKHPKAFAWMVHHPQFTFEGSSHSQLFLDNPEYLRVDDGFVKKYYTSDESRGLTTQYASNKNKTLVILPDIEGLTTDICACLEKFVEIVTQNEVYREILDEESTIVNYFSQLDGT
jgi:hypothetical protein